MRVVRGEALGALLRNAQSTYPVLGDNPGKLGLIPHRRRVLESLYAESRKAVQDGTVSYQLVVGVTASQGDNGYGP